MPGSYSDLAIGFPWKKELIEKAGLGTAALIAVVTDKYADRPWCLREKQEARKPGCDQYDQQLKNLWIVNPVFVVDDLKSRATRCLPEFFFSLKLSSFFFWVLKCIWASL